MNEKISEIFSVLLNLFHILIVLSLLLFAFFGDNLIYDSGVRLGATIGGFIAYTIVFGAVTKLVVIRDELAEINEQLKESNHKMALFFGYIEEEITKNNSSAKKKT